MLCPRAPCAHVGPQCSGHMSSVNRPAHNRLKMLGANLTSTRAQKGKVATCRFPVQAPHDLVMVMISISSPTTGIVLSSALRRLANAAADAFISSTWMPKRIAFLLACNSAFLCWRPMPSHSSQDEEESPQWGSHLYGCTPSPRRLGSPRWKAEDSREIHHPSC